MAAVTRFAGTLALALLGALPGVLRVGHADAGEPDGERDDAGALVLFVARVEDHAAVEGAKVTLTGTSRSGAPVSKVGVTDREGRASLEGVPAGFAYRVEIASAGRPLRIVSGVKVRRALATTLLPIFVGARVTLEGRFVDESGVAMPGAEVRAFDEVLSRASRLPIYDAGEAAEVAEIPEPSAAGRAVTDAQGRYRIEDLPAGPIVLRATIEGRRESIASVFLGPDGPAGGPPIRVLWPGSPVSGTVVDGDGQPVGGAEVIVSSARGESARGDSNERRRAVSDAKGRFRVTVADSGGFNVAARRPGTRLRSWQEFESPPPDVRVPLASATALSLTLLDRGDDRPLSGGSVEVGVRDSMDPFQRDLWTTTASGTTDDEGRLTLPVPAGFVSSWAVTAAGHQGATIDNIYWIPIGDLEAVLPIFGRRLRAGKPLALTFRLSARVAGVERSGPDIRGRIVGPEGRAVAGARVVGVAVGALSPRAVSTDAEGRFRLEGAAEQILVRANGFVQRAEDRFGTGAASEGATPELTLRLERPRTVRGRILDAEGHGVAGARVSILPKWSNDASVTTENRGVYEALRDPWATTAIDGTYVMNDLVPLISVPKDDRDNEVKDAGRAPGPARIVVRARGFADALSDPFLYETAGVTQAPVLRLSRGARWRGRILDPAGHPVPGAQIRVEADAEATSVVEFAADGAWRSARDGSFLVSALPPGTVKVIAWAEGYASTQKSMHVLYEGDLPSLDVVLRPAQRIPGRILDPAGRPIGGVDVLLDWLARKSGVSGAFPIPDSDWDAMYTKQQRARTDGDGRFVLEGVPPGVVELRLQAEGWRDPRTHRAPGHVEIRAEGPPPEFVLERDPEWSARKREELEARLTSVREELPSFTDPQVREAAQEEIQRLEEELRGFAADAAR
jgi:protocatechuate 3,4-dioxygenase beta subunit